MSRFIFQPLFSPTPMAYAIGVALCLSYGVVRAQGVIGTDNPSPVITAPSPASRETLPQPSDNNTTQSSASLTHSDHPQKPDPSPEKDKGSTLSPEAPEAKTPASDAPATSGTTEGKNEAEPVKDERPEGSGTAAPEEAPPWIWVDLCLTDNQVCLSGISARQKSGKWEVDLSPENIQQLEINPEFFPIHEDGEGRWVALDEIKFDESTLKIEWTVGANHLLAQGLKQQQAKVKLSDSTKPFSAAFNYSLSYSQIATLYSDVAIGKGNLAFLTNYSWDQDSKIFDRGLTSLEYDHLKWGVRWSLGDVSASTPDPLASGTLLKGIGVRKSFEQDPTQIIVARPQMSGIVDRPGTLEVYSNGILISSQEVRPGPYTLENLGIASGRQNIRIVLRDVTGNRTTLTNTSYYGSSELLAKGLNDYAVTAGEMYNNAIMNIDEGAIFKKKHLIQGYWRRGINERLTLGVRAEASEDVHTYGIMGAVATPVGEISGSIAKSSEGGMAYFGAYNYSARKWSVGYSQYQRDDNYVLPTSVYDVDTASITKSSQSANVSLGFIPRVSIGFQANNVMYANGVREKSQNATLGGDLFKKVQWSLLFRKTQRTDQPIHDKSISLLFSVPLGSDKHASITAENTNVGTSYGGSFSKSRLEETGLSYTANASQSAIGTQSYTARADYQSTHAQYGVQMDRLGDQQTTIGNISGSVVIGGGSVFLAPPLGSAFAIIRAPKAPNAPVLRESTPVGKTNSKGSALIRNLTPFYPSQLGFDPALLDINVDTGNVISKTILPTAYTATLVEFDAAPAQAIQAQLAWPDGEKNFLKYGSINFGTPLNQEVSLGGTGLLWLEKVPAGQFEGLASTEQGTAKCIINVPETEEGVQDLGVITCERLTGKPATSDTSSAEKSKENKQVTPDATQEVSSILEKGYTLPKVLVPLVKPAVEKKP